MSPVKEPSSVENSAFATKDLALSSAVTLGGEQEFVGTVWPPGHRLTCLSWPEPDCAGPHGQELRVGFLRYPPNLQTISRRLGQDTSLGKPFPGQKDQ